MKNNWRSRSGRTGRMSKDILALKLCEFSFGKNWTKIHKTGGQEWPTNNSCSWSGRHCPVHCLRNGQNGQISWVDGTISLSSILFFHQLGWQHLHRSHLAQLFSTSLWDEEGYHLTDWNRITGREDTVRSFRSIYESLWSLPQWPVFTLKTVTKCWQVSLLSSNTGKIIVQLVTLTNFTHWAISLIVSGKNRSLILTLHILKNGENVLTLRHACFILVSKL